MLLHETIPLNEMEALFRSLYENVAEQLRFDPLRASFQVYQSLREAMLPELDYIMMEFGEIWHRMPAYAPDSLTAKDHRDVSYIPRVGFARYIPIPEHASESYEIILCTGGFNRHYVGQEPIDLVPGDVLLVAPGAIHATGAFAVECMRRSIMLRRGRVKERFAPLILGNGVLARFFRHTMDGMGGNSWCRYRMGENLIQNLWMRELYRQTPRDDPRQTATEDGLLMTFLAQLDLQYGETAQFAFCKFGSVGDEILDCLRREFATVNRQVLAERFGYSERQILRIVQQKTGMTYKTYLTKLRMDYVADMLISTRVPILQILESAGYENSRSFYDTFRERFGMTPTEYRDRYI